MELRNIALTPGKDALRILDQSLLPGEIRYLELHTPEDLYEAIVSLRVRGAPAIGIFAAYAFYLLAKGEAHLAGQAFFSRCRAIAAHLATARPTAVNLEKMLARMLQKALSLEGASTARILQALEEEAHRIQEEDEAMCRAISEYGLTLLKPGDGVLTHCNAGPLATSRYGTALGPLFLAKERGIPLKVWCDETRPLLQGARLTALELHMAEIPCTLICDNMASLVMSQGNISACLVGCDRIARNGDTANKIGTSGVAILARHYGIPFYVLGPSTTIDFSCETGEDIPIELRPEGEIREMFYEKPMAPLGIPCYNPAFDVTPGALITAIITERGICTPPYSQSFATLFPTQWKEATP